VSKAAAGLGCFALVGLFTGLMALSVSFSCLLGYAASWVLSHFGVKVAWYVCSVAIWLLMVIFRQRGSSK
jgi:hypothetical protein